VGGKPSGFTPGSQDAMTRYDESDWVLPQRLSDGARGIRSARAAGNLAVTPRLPRGNLSDGSIHLPRKWRRPCQVHGNIAKFLHFPLQMFAHTLDDRGDGRRRSAQ
jgi:hypothetical protein